MHVVTVKKWGNSLGLRIPAAAIKGVGVSENTELEFRVVNGQIILTPCSEVPTLEQLMSQCTAENTHDVVDWGPPVGAEVW